MTSKNYKVNTKDMRKFLMETNGWCNDFAEGDEKYQIEQRSDVQLKESMYEQQKVNRKLIS